MDSNDSSRAAGDNGDAIPSFKDFVGITDSVGAAGTGGGRSEFAPLAPISMETLGRRHIGNHHRDEEGLTRSGPFSFNIFNLFGEVDKPPMPLPT